MTCKESHGGENGQARVQTAILSSAHDRPLTIRRRLKWRRGAHEGEINFFSIPGFNVLLDRLQVSDTSDDGLLMISLGWSLRQLGTRRVVVPGRQCGCATEPTNDPRRK